MEKTKEKKIISAVVYLNNDEDVILPFAQSVEYHLIVQELIYGYEQDSDSLFIAVLRKN